MTARPELSIPTKRKLWRALALIRRTLAEPDVRASLGDDEGFHSNLSNACYLIEASTGLDRLNRSLAEPRPDGPPSPQSAGGHARAATLSREERQAIARAGAVARWRGPPK